MDKLRFGEIELRGSVHAAKANVEGESLPALELRLEGPADQAALEAMTGNDLVICGEDGAEQGRHAGYDLIAGHTVVLAKRNPQQKALARAQTALKQVQEENQALEQENAALLYAALTGEEL